MKLKKLIFALFIPFFLTGCADVTYNLEINRNLNVKEEVVVTGTSNYFDNFYRDLPITIVREFYDDKEFMAPLKSKNYDYELINEDALYPSVLIKKDYNDLAEYVNNTIFKGQSFEKIVSDTNNNLITLKTEGFIPYQDEVTYGYSVSRLNVNITVPYQVTDNNADAYDAKTNTYTWRINEETTAKEIKITFDKSKPYVYNLSMYISIGILFILASIIIIIVFYFIKKGKINNKIKE